MSASSPERAINRILNVTMHNIKGMLNHLHISLAYSLDQTSVGLLHRAYKLGIRSIQFFKKELINCFTGVGNYNYIAVF